MLKKNKLNVIYLFRSSNKVEKCEFVQSLKEVKLSMTKVPDALV